MTEYDELFNQYRIWSDDSAYAEVFHFKGDKGCSEHHLMFHYTEPGQPFEIQLKTIMEHYRGIMEEDMKGQVAVFRRIFLSDVANQEEIVKDSLAKETAPVSTSIVEQPPLDGTKLAMWVYLIEGAECKTVGKNLQETRLGSYRHLWGGTEYTNTGNSHYQTHKLLTEYAKQLEENGMTLEENCVRTWFFVQNVDVNYQGLVEGRNEVFAQHNLTPETHYISSTGIGGRNSDRNALVQLNSYAVGGLKPGQMKFLYAKSHMNATYEYGVSFERGTYIDYGDRRHVFISGTASIDEKGEVMHVGNIEKQVHRMWENVEALLEEAGCGWKDVAHIIVYLRDPSDYVQVAQLFFDKFAELPKAFVLAPVCRPSWLVEMECMAVKKTKNPDFADFFQHKTKVSH